MSFDDGDVERLLADLASWAAMSRTTEEAGARSRRAWLHQQAAEETSLEALLIGWAERRAWVRMTTVAGTAHNGEIAALGRDFVLLGAGGGGRGDANRPVLVKRAAIASIRRAPKPLGESYDGAEEASLVRFETAPDRRLDAKVRPGWPDEAGPGPGWPTEPGWPDEAGPGPGWPTEPGWPDEAGRAGPGQLEASRVSSPPIDLAGALSGLAAERPRLRIITGPASSVVGELRWVGSDVACLRLEGPPPAPAYVPLARVIEVSILTR